MRLGTRVMVLDVDGKPTDITGTFHGIGHVQSGHSEVPSYTVVTTRIFQRII